MKTDDKLSGVGRWMFGCVAVLATLSLPACRKATQLESVARAITGAPVTWAGGEMLLRPTDHSVTVKAIAAQPVEVYFEYGPYAGSYTGSTTPATYDIDLGNNTDGHIYVVEAVIADLNSNTRYKYRMRYRAKNDLDDFYTGADYDFQTKRAKDAGLVFAVQSDSHMGYAPYHDAQVYARPCST
jgi:hypothetical protein